MEESENPRRRRNEELLLESAVWTADLGAYEWDMRNDRVRWLNRWCQFYDIDPCEGEHHGERWRALVHPEDRAKALHEFDEHVAGRRARYEGEYRMRTLSGKWRWIRNRAYVVRSPADGRDERLVGACVDIDERKRAELELGRTQRKLEALAAAAPIWMVLTDAAGIIEFVNRPMVCLTPGPVLGRNIVSLFTEPGEAARVEEFLRSLVAGCASTMHTMVLEDGRALATWAQPIVEAGAVVGIASVTADVSERQHRERELLEVVNREQRRFSRDLHDGLGQELTGISLLVKSLCSRAAADSPGLAAHLDEVLKHVTAAIATTRAVARGVSPVGHEHGGLAHALENLARHWRDTAGPTVVCKVAICEAWELDPMLAENFYRIGQEALTNAMRHSGADEIVMELRHTPRRLTLTVSDNGRGIPAAARRGGGLGLNIMRGRAELIGAQLKIDAGSSGTRIECLHKRPRLP